MMINLFIIINVFVVAVVSQKYGLYHFSDEKTLVECITKYVKSSGNYSIPQEKFLSNVANFFKLRTYTIEELDTKVTSVMNYLDQDFSGLQENPILKEQLKNLIKKALLHCRVKDKSFLYKNIPDDFLNRELLPYFAEEQPDYALILDYVLVYWLDSLPGMIGMRKTRSILRSYVNDVLEIFERLNLTRIMINSDGSYNEQDDINAEIRRLWKRRSELFFDDRNPGTQYVDHIYTRNYRFPHTHGHISQFIGLHTENDRNPRVSQERVQEILNVHVMSNTFAYDRGDPYNFYDTYGMSSAEYYLEKHINDFYRAIFFILELQARGIETDEDDTYHWFIPNHVLPDDIQKIIHDDDAYRDYLLDQTCDEMSRNDPENPHWMNILRSRRAREIDLIMLFLRRIRCQSRVKSTIATTSTEAFMTTSEYWDMTKTGAIPKRRRPYRDVELSCDIYAVPSKIKSCEKLKQSRKQKRLKEQMIEEDTFHAYIFYNDDFIETEESSLLQLLDVINLEQIFLT